MKIWFISDTHTLHNDLQIPIADVVIHCGDEANNRKDWKNKLESRAFFNWFCDLDIETKIFVPGNHSTAIAAGLVLPSDYPDVHFLIHQSMELRGLKIFGSPYTPLFFAWAYNVARPDLEKYWVEIPSDTDILITHGPPKGILDLTPDWRTKVPIPIGSASLTRHVMERIQPRIHAFGHLHDQTGIKNFGSITKGKTQFINCACCNMSGEIASHGMVVEVTAPIMTQTK